MKAVYQSTRHAQFSRYFTLGIWALALLLFAYAQRGV
jgi:hypothetical protein